MHKTKKKKNKIELMQNAKIECKMQYIESMQNAVTTNAKKLKCKIL